MIEECKVSVEIYSMRVMEELQESEASKIKSVPGEEASEKSFYIKLWVWHDACIQVEVIQPLIPAGDKQRHRSFML